jgi:hypothetical protein
MLIIIMLGIMSIKANAASQIEIVPTATGIRNVNVSTSFVTCRNLDSLNSTLGTTALDPHLVTNADFGAVSYLANSVYGVGADGHTAEQTQGKCGKLITMDGINYYSTTPNITGVMNWGANPNSTTYTQTASLLSTATADTITNEDTKTNVTSLLSGGTKYVDRLTSSGSTKGMAIGETSGWGKWNGFYSDNNYPVCIRNGLFGFCGRQRRLRRYSGREAFRHDLQTSNLEYITKLEVQKYCVLNSVVLLKNFFDWHIVTVKELY